MSLDKRIRDSIRDAAIARGQSEVLVDRLTAWIEGLASGNESLDDRDSVQRHLDLLYAAVHVEGDKEDGA